VADICFGLLHYKVGGDDLDNFTKALLDSGSTALPNILLQNIGKLKMTSDEFMLFVTLWHYHEKGIGFPGIEQLSAALGFSQQAIFQTLHSLTEKKFVTIKTTHDAQQVQQDTYDLMPIFDRLALVLQQATTANLVHEQQATRDSLFKQIEVEFNRPLSPIEIETIDAWINQDHYNPDLIQLALREAVLNQVYSLKYIDRILLSWEKKNITTKEQVQREKDLRNQY
jgi:DNA replication protein